MSKLKMAGAAVGALTLTALALPGPAHASGIEGWTPTDATRVIAVGDVVTMDATDGGVNIGRDVDWTVTDLAESINFEVRATPACSGAEEILVVLYVADGGNLSGHVTSCATGWTPVTADDLTWFDFTSEPSGEVTPLEWSDVVESHGDEQVNRIELATVGAMVADFRQIVLGEPVTVLADDDNSGEDGKDDDKDGKDDDKNGKDDDKDKLPVTGSDAGAIAGVGGVLLAAGAGLALMRRRRTTFEA